MATMTPAQITAELTRKAKLTKSGTPTLPTNPAHMAEYNQILAGLNTPKATVPPVEAISPTTSSVTAGALPATSNPYNDPYFADIAKRLAAVPATPAVATPVAPAVVAPVQSAVDSSVKVVHPVATQPDPYKDPYFADIAARLAQPQTTVPTTTPPPNPNNPPPKVDAGMPTLPASVPANNGQPVNVPATNEQQINPLPNTYVDPAMNILAQAYGQDYAATQKATNDYITTGSFTLPNSSIIEGTRQSVTPEGYAAYGLNPDGTTNLQGTSNLQGTLPAAAGMPNAQQSTQPATYAAPTTNTTQQPPKYEAETLALLSKIMNPEKFVFNAETDPSYQSSKKQFESEGQTAFNNIIGSLSALTGGRPSTAAIGTAQGGYNKYLQGLPAVLAASEQNAYSRYQDENDNTYKQLEVINGMADDEYKKLRDIVGDTQWQSTFDEGVREWNAAQTLDEQKFAADKIQNAIQNAAQYQGTYNNQPTIAQQQYTTQQQQLADDKVKQDFVNTIDRYAGNYQTEINRIKNSSDRSEDWKLPYLESARQGKIATTKEADQKVFIDTIGQYYNDVGLEINKIANDNDTSNDWKLPYLKAMKVEKEAAIAEKKKADKEALRVVNDATAKTNYDNAMEIWKTSGVATPEVARILGISVGAKTEQYVQAQMSNAIAQQNADTAAKNATTSASETTTEKPLVSVSDYSTYIENNFYVDEVDSATQTKTGRKILMPSGQQKLFNYLGALLDSGVDKNVVDALAAKYGITGEETQQPFIGPPAPQNY